MITHDCLYVTNALSAILFSETSSKMKEQSILGLCLCFGDDSQEEGGGLVRVESGWHNQVFTRLQHKELHHLTCIHVGFSLGNRCVALEERGRELSCVGLVLQRKMYQFSAQCR